MTRRARQSEDCTGAVVAIGNFDGVHLGHQALLGQVARLAQARLLRAVALTFDPHPVEVLAQRRPLVLTTLETKRRLIRGLHPELSVHVEPFDLELAASTPEAFVDRVLVRSVGAKVVVVGRNFRFGKGRAGDFGVLERLGSSRGVEAVAAELVSVSGGVVSSSRLRRSVAEGDVALAHQLLGRPHAVSGVCVHGQARGRALGFPTANLERVPQMLPADGVYVGYLAGASDSALPDRAPCVVNIGHRPTVSGKGRQVEAHVLDFSGDLYAQELRLEFVKRLRDEARYESLDELQRQIDRDVTQARRVLGSVPERAG